MSVLKGVKYKLRNELFLPKAIFINTCPVDKIHLRAPQRLLDIQVGITDLRSNECKLIHVSLAPILLVVSTSAKPTHLSSDSLTHLEINTI